MTENEKKPSRRQQILEALAHELEMNPGERITTAGLARAVGVSEAALYRHFPSKAKMFEGLIEFIEESIFSLINRILKEQDSSLKRCENILSLLLGFSERNPGLTRILSGDVLTGETERLRLRVSQFYERLETQLKQVLREGEMNKELVLAAPVQAQANLLLAVVEGRIIQFVRSGFKRSPIENWNNQWTLLIKMFT
ncbi:MAG: nucleoid occlusion factor SlmA [Gammaproteobacteria bacterium]|nr:nucleoid occlusion factor SlmA [Gammaproteobacteria bacterium]MCW9032374.1 nucleoid occlusion factor SlmA [Gammaproteobacteria bacterium]